MSAASQSIAGPNTSITAAEPELVGEEFDYCARHGLRLTPARNHGWLVRADPPGAHDGVVLGCIEDSEDQFELMQLSDGFRWSLHDSLHDALQCLVDDLSSADATLSLPDLSRTLRSIPEKATSR